MTPTELALIRPLTGIFARRTWALLYGHILQRPVSVEEVDEAHRLFFDEYYAAHPDEPRSTFAFIAHSPNLFWQSQSLTRPIS